MILSMTAQTVGGEDINVFEIDVKIIFKVSFSVKEKNARTQEN